MEPASAALSLASHDFSFSLYTVDKNDDLFLIT